MRTDTVVRARIDSDTKERATAALEATKNHHFAIAPFP
jgi:antitoxin component of RelBE/YafQ-DinJ toxin-antitoxin module